MGISWMISPEFCKSVPRRKRIKFSPGMALLELLDQVEDVICVEDQVSTGAKTSFENKKSSEIPLKPDVVGPSVVSTKKVKTEPANVYFLVFEVSEKQFVGPNGSQCTSKERRVQVARLQETRWKGNKGGECNGYKLWYMGTDGAKNGVGFLVACEFKDNVVEVRRYNDRIMVLRIVLREEVVSVISAYAPQVGLGDQEKRQIWDLLDVTLGARVGILMATSVRIVMVSLRSGGGYNESWWWNDEVQGKVQAKNECFRKLRNCIGDVERARLTELYRVAKREAKKVVSETKNTAYWEMYERFEARDWEHDIFKIAKARERRRQDLGVVKFIKGEDGRVLVKEKDITTRWLNYFNNLYNGGRQEDNEGSTNVGQQRNWCYCKRITTEEVGRALRKMGRAKAVGPDNIPIEVWTCLAGEGVTWLMTLFNTILKTRRMPNQWRSSVLIPLYKKKGIEARLRRETQISMNQFGFMPGRWTTEAIHIMRRLMEKYRDKKQDLHMVFIDLEKAYDNIPRQVIWDSLGSRGIPWQYIELLVKDMYRGAKTSVRARVGDFDFFSVDIVLHQGSALSPFLFTIVLDELSKSVQVDIPWCMLFTDDIVLVAEKKNELNVRLEEWHAALEQKGLRISWSKTEYLHCNFSGTNTEGDINLTIDRVLVPQTTKFKYLGSSFQCDGDIDYDVTHRIQAGWCKWRAASSVLNEDVEMDVWPYEVLRLLDEECGEERSVYLSDDWFYSVIAPGDTVHVIGEFNEGICEVNRDKNFVIVHPDTLVSGTRVAASFSCPRRTVLDERLKNNEQSAAALVGTLLHKLFQAGLIREIPTKEFLEEYARVLLQKNYESLYACGVYEGDIHKTMIEAIPRLLNWILLFRDSKVPSSSVNFGSNDEVKKVNVSETHSGSIESSGLGDVYSSLVNHLTTSHCNFLKKWERLINLEANELEVVKKEMWGSRSMNSAHSSTCLSSIVLDTSDQVLHKNFIQGNRFVYCFTRQDSNPSSSGKDLECSLKTGDYVILSTDPDRLVIGSGVIMGITRINVTV
ncbi:hypothetical protein SSX86_011469 [Deinandra increscens subsp. villosa]|uniref:Reverse transcriptase domain-containing protein n=1 Tax=Deinandra increscens subsp. villosa TaxID=3103831 RepID=A0AAP0D6L0_9ASTR